MLEPGGEADFLSFMQENLDKWERFRSFWQWRQENKEVSGGETAAIAKEKGEVVGCVGIVPVSLNFQGSQIKASWQQDSLVSPSMRGKGLGKKLVNKGMIGWNLVIAKGTSKAMYGLRKSLGFIDVPNSDYLVRICKARPLNGKLLERIGEHIMFIWKSLLLMPKIDGDIRIQSVDIFDKSFDALADEFSRDNVLRPYKDSVYLNWRYFKCPVKEYKVFRAGEDKARGAIVLNISGDKSDEGWIVDFVCSSGDKRCAYTLIRKAIMYFEKQNVSRIWVFATLSLARKCLFRFGFLPTDKTPKFTYKIMDNSLYSQSISDALWDFWHGDGDIELYQ